MDDNASIVALSHILERYRLLFPTAIVELSKHRVDFV